MPASLATALALGKIAASGASIVAWAKGDKPLDHLKELFEAVGKGGEAAEKLRGAEVPTLRKALEDSRSALEQAYAEAFKHDHSSSYRERVDVALANLGEVFDKCVPQGQELAKLKHDPQAIGRSIADAAVARQMEIFRDGESRALLIRLVVLAYTSLDKNPKFMEALERANWQEALEQLADIKRDTAHIRAMVDKLTESLSLTEAERAELAADLAATKTKLSSTNDLVGGFLQAILRENIPPDQFAATLFRLAAEWREAGARLDALSASRNLTPKVAGLREKARVAHAAGDVAEATRLLEEIDAEEKNAEARLAEHRREIEAEFRLRREGRIATKDAQISLALAALRHADAARFIAEQVDLAEEDPAKRFTMLRKVQDDFYVRGRDKGLNADLIVSVETGRIVVARATNAGQRGMALNDLAVSLTTLGERESGASRLEEAVTAYRTALQERTRERVPLEWAMTQNNLGSALARLGERESGTPRLEEAVTAFRAALEERTRARVPLYWAMTQNNLGSALQGLGERENGTARLEEAVTAYRAALQEYTRERAPFEWAMTQNNVGSALARLGEREGSTARLEEALTAFRAALEERTRERVPLDWASIQNNLGNILLTLGERESGTARLWEAVTAFRAALEEYTRERVPLDWATTQNNLGTALARLGERESGTARLWEAVTAFRAALEENTRERVPLEWAMTQNNLGNVLTRLGERESGTARLDEAVTACHAALEENTRERVPLAWARTQNSLGTALQLLGGRERGIARLDEAVTAYRAALEEYTRERVPLEWARTHNNIGNTLRTIGERESGTTRLQEAVTAIRAALQEYTHERVPLDWATTQNNLGNALLRLGERESGTASLEEAIAAYQNALAVLTPEKAPAYRELVQRNLGICASLLDARRRGVSRPR
jgi:tetratricopeptide (TPR) repeat protein